MFVLALGRRPRRRAAQVTQGLVQAMQPGRRPGSPRGNTGGDAPRRGGAGGVCSPVCAVEATGAAGRRHGPQITRPAADPGLRSRPGSSPLAAVAGAPVLLGGPIARATPPLPLLVVARCPQARHGLSGRLRPRLDRTQPVEPRVQAVRQHVELRSLCLGPGGCTRARTGTHRGCSGLQHPPSAPPVVPRRHECLPDPRVGPLLPLQPGPRPVHEVLLPAAPHQRVKAPRGPLPGGPGAGHALHELLHGIG